MTDITYQKSEYGTCARLTWNQFYELFDAQDLVKGEKRGHLTTRGPWGIPVSYKALAVNTRDGVIYGYRTLSNVKQLGYELEGKVSIQGKKRRGFSSSLLIELPDGQLFSAAIIYVC